MEIAVTKDELYSFVTEAVRKGLQEERIEFFFKNIPLASREEMEDIERLYGKPSRGKEVAYSETIEL